MTPPIVIEMSEEVENEAWKPERTQITSSSEEMDVDSASYDDVDSTLFTFRKWFHSKLEDGFEAIARFASQWPHAVIFFGLVVTMICGLGILNLRVITDYEQTWIPRHTEAWDHRTIFYSHFERPPRVETIVLVAKIDGGSSAALLEALSLHQEIIEITGFESLCLRPYLAGPCTYSSVFGIWNYSASTIAGSILYTYQLGLGVDVQFGVFFELDVTLDRLVNRAGVRVSLTQCFVN